MKTTKLSPHYTLILAISALTLASLACSAIAPETPVPTQLPALTTAAAEISKLPAKPSPTPAFAQPSPAPVATEPPAESATVAPLPPANWQPIPDLPRQINTLVVNPADPQVLYAGTGSTGAGSGVYKSEDGGFTWRLAATGLPGEDVQSLAFSHDDSPVLYAVVDTGDGDIFASTNGAESWTRLGEAGLIGFEARLAVAPSDANTIFIVKDVRGAARSHDGGYTWLPVGEGLPQDDSGDVNAQAIAIDPTDANVVYLGTGWGSFNGNGVYKSTDGGETWAPANRGMLDYGITALAVDPANPQIVYAGGYGGELFKSDDGGETWSNLTDKLPGEEHSCSSIRDIAIDPTAPETLFLLGEHVGVLVSYDGGTRWRVLGKPGEPDYPSFTAMTIIFNPQPVLVVGIRDEGGWRYGAGQSAAAPIETPPPPVDMTAAPTPPPGSWQAAPDLPLQINALVVNPADPQVLYAGTGLVGSGSGVYKSEDGGLTWRLAAAGLSGGDVQSLAFSHDDSPVLYAVVGIGDGDMFASTDGAASWTRLGNAGSIGFKTRLIVAPSDGNVLFTVKDVRGVARSRDGGRNWLPVGEGLPKDEDGDVDAQSLAIDPTDANVVYLGTGWGSFNGNGVYKSTDGGETWAPANRGMLDYGITALAMNPADTQIVYAGGYGGELFKSADGGETWSDLTPNLPDQTNVIEIIVDPAAPQTVYLLCDQLGVLVSYDGGARWRLLGKPGGPDYPLFTAMAIIFEPQPVLVVGIRDEGGWRYSAD